MQYFVLFKTGSSEVKSSNVFFSASSKEGKRGKTRSGDTDLRRSGVGRIEKARTRTLKMTIVIGEKH